ncbi:hypothetical protein MTO96_028034 [Rhipicephalus appendiculatus]
MYIHRCNAFVWTRIAPTNKVIKQVPDREVAPLSTLDELIKFKEEPLLCAVEPLSDAIKRGKPGDPRTIFCHDMDGNYKEDRFIHGSDEHNVYRFHHWQIIDTFVYYSHHMVTIPPPGWISAAHRHGVKVLGTFIVGEEDIKTINIIRGSGQTTQVATQLANVATVGRFDGWVISIGCKIDRICIPFVKDLLKAITTEMHRAVPGSLVIWYDAVDVDGKVKPQNELNQKNAGFLDLCDGIFINFRWTEAMLLSSAQLAGNRKADVYVGVDVYGRGTKYPGGYETYKAVELVRRCGLSAAVFAAAWVYETQCKKDFAKNQYRLWNFPDSCCSEWRLTKPPLSTSFCQGFGSKVYANGQSQLGRVWFNLHKQQLQPRDQDTKPYIRLFGCDFPLGPLVVSYTFKNISVSSTAGQDIAIATTYRVTRETIRKPMYEGEETETAWLTRKYHLEDLRGADGAILEEIGLRFCCVGRETIVCLLGQLDVRRLDDAEKAAQKAVDNEDSSSDDEPERKRRREEQYDLDAVIAE